MPAPDHDTIFRLEARLREIAQDFGMSFDELVNAIQVLREFREWTECRAKARAEDKEMSDYTPPYAIAENIEKLEAELATLRALVADYEDVIADKRRLAREIDVAMHGEEGAAKQASLCDLVVLAARLRTQLDIAREALAPFAWAADAWDDADGDELVFLRYAGRHLSIGDLRRALRALAVLDGKEHRDG